MNHHLVLEVGETHFHTEEVVGARRKVLPQLWGKAGESSRTSPETISRETSCHSAAIAILHAKNELTQIETNFMVGLLQLCNKTENACIEKGAKF